MRRLTILTCLIALLIVAIATPGRSQTGDAVLNKAGIDIKLITKRDCKLYKDADSNSDSAPCRVFTFWFVLPPDPMPKAPRLEDLPSLTKNGFYRVSTTDKESDFQGWIHEDDATEWHHRQALGFASRTMRAPACFFIEENEAQEAVRTGNVGNPLAREPESTQGNLILMPLLHAKDTSINDQEMKLYQVAFIAARPDKTGVPDPGVGGGGGEPGEDDKPTVKEAAKKATVDIVFVLDTTNSMAPPIEMVLKSISQAAKNLAANQEVGNRFRFGLIGYRDIIADMGPGGLEYLTKIFCTLEEGENHQIFLDRLKSVKVANVGSGDWPEDALAGLDLAMEFDKMKWNEFSWKIIVLVGDASIKGPDHPLSGHQRNDQDRTIASMLAKAQAGGQSSDALKTTFVINAVHVRNPKNEDDNNIGDKQFEQLCRARQYQGNLIKARGGGNPEDFSGALTKVINTQTENFQTQIVQNPNPHKIQQPPSGQTQTNAGVFPLPLVDLLATLPTDPGGVDLDMGFASGHCTEFDTEGNRQFVPHVFVRQNQLKQFIHAVSYLQVHLEDAGEPGNKDVESVVRNLQVLSTGLNLSEPISAEMDLADFLQALLGFPLKTPIFYVTIHKLAAMSQADYDAWVKDVKSYQETLDQLIENPNIWYKLNETAKGKQLYAFVDLNDLP